MKLFFYYAFHSVINQIKKLCKTWFIILLLACVILGVAFGFFAGMLIDSADTPEEDPAISETEPEEGEEEIELTDEELTSVIELAVLGITLLVLTINCVFADKSGSSIFQPADVTLLFPSPLKPQSVLFFRLMTQIGMMIFVTLYLVFDIPVLLETPSGGGLFVISVFLAWLLLAVIGKFLQIYLYAVCSTHPTWKKRILPVTVTTLGALALAFGIFYKTASLPLLSALDAFFNPRWTRLIPVVGWVKGLVLSALEGSTLAMLGYLAALLATAVGMVFLIYRSKADFYEDAMAKTEETARLITDATEGRTAIRTGKKDRSERIRRDEFHYGAGAKVFFHKTIYNRARFAPLGVLTKTAIVYLAVAVIFSVIIKTEDLTVIALILAAIAFFRSLANPLAGDLSTVYFSLLPENTWAKMFWSILGGTATTFLDLLPAMIVATIATGAGFMTMVAWIGFILTLDFYSSMAIAFLDRSVPEHIGKNFKQVVQVLFIYFGLLPDIALIAIGSYLGSFVPFAFLAAGVNLLLAGIFFAVTPMMIERGR